MTRWRTKHGRRRAALWYEEVVRLCRSRGFARWFYADRSAWLELRTDERMTPQQAVSYQIECLY